MTLLLALPAASMGSVVFSAAEPARFGRDVLPILSANCFACHGPDETNRKARLRLDVEAEAKAARRSGAPIAPGQPEKSLIIKRLTSADPDVVMPPPSAHKQVSPEQIETLRRWIAEGAKWGRHWSFEPPIKPAVASGRHPVDSLVSAALAKRGIELRPSAAPQTLARRLWLDIIGLPPTPEIADKFAADPSPAAYERMVDELLKKPQFGEHWARMWLDLARYADTKGYEKDRGRTMWPYRDWVVNALNADMPLDRFTIEQLAGDLLPNPTQQQLIATAFHRNTMANDEGGTDDEEFRVAAVKDRADTTAQVWMGLTIGCAKCHTHKYDPISHSEYYSFYALFNQTEDADRFDDAPTLEVISPGDLEERKRLQTLVNTLVGKLNTLEEDADKAYEIEERKWRVAEVAEAVSKGGATLTAQKDGVVAVSGKAPQEDVYIVTLTITAGVHTALRLEALPEKLGSGELAVGRNGANQNFVLTELAAESLDGEDARPLKLNGARADFAQDNKPIDAAIDGDEKSGWAVSPRTHERRAALFNFADPLRLARNSKIRVTLSQQAGEVLTLRRFRLSTSGEDPTVLHPRVDAEEIRKLRDDLAARIPGAEKFQRKYSQAAAHA